ncbi:MAG: alanine--tRNA ligase-related protein [Dictyoglomus sp.]
MYIIIAMNTKRIYYENPENFIWESRILDVKKESNFLIVKLDETIFYPEGGGQPSDRGEIKGDGWSIYVAHVYEEKGDVWHKGEFKGNRIPEIGERAKLLVNEILRREYMEQHTAQHLLSAVLEKEYSLETTGFQILEDHTKIEIPYKGEKPDLFVEEIERKVNNYIRKDIGLRIYWKDNSTRIVEIPGLDLNPCGGLHVKNLRDLGLLKIISFYKKNSNYWRIEFVAGRRVLKRFGEREREYKYFKEKLGNPDVVDGLNKLISKLEELEKENKKLREELSAYVASELLIKAKSYKGEKVILDILNKNILEIKNIAQKILEQEKVLGMLFNEEGQGILFRSRNIKDDIFQEFVNILVENGWRGNKEGFFLQGKANNPKDIIQQISKLFVNYL